MDIDLVVEAIVIIDIKYFLIPIFFWAVGTLFGAFHHMRRNGNVALTVNGEVYPTLDGWNIARRQRQQQQQEDENAQIHLDAL